MDNPVPVPVPVPAPPAAPVIAPTRFELDLVDHTREEIDLLANFYMKKRLQAQMDFYKARVDEYEDNADLTFKLTTGIMSASALLSAINTVSSQSEINWLISLTAAILPALAAMLAAFRQVYSWDRQAALYRDALLSLEKAKLIWPDDDRLPFSPIQAIYPQMVTEGEKVFTAEVSQWGQFILDKDNVDQETPADNLLKRQLMSVALTEQQREQIKTIIRAGRAPSAGATSTQERAQIEAALEAVSSTDSDSETGGPQG